jgi:uridine phosphorylase
MEISAAEWLAALRLPQADIPDIVIVEGTWWRAERTAWRLSYLEDVRELAFPDIFFGRWQGRKVIYCCAYGAPRTVEIIHLFGLLGAQLAVQIGTCGGLQPHLQTGDIILPTTALCREGVAHYYGTPESVDAAPAWVARAQEWLIQRGHTTYTGAHLTWSALFAQDAALVERWHAAGYLAVDMETATTLAVSRYFGMAALSMLVVWDDWVYAVPSGSWSMAAWATALARAALCDRSAGQRRGQPSPRRRGRRFCANSRRTLTSA